MPEPADRPPSLRDRIAEAVLGFHGRTGADASDRALAYGTADAVMPIIEGLPNRGYCEHCGRGDCAPTAEQYHQLTQRAEEAERERDKARDAIADERLPRRAAEAAVRRVRLVCMPPTAPDLRTEVLAALDAERRPGQFWEDLRKNIKDPEFRREYVAFSQEIAALDAEQPKETP